MSPPENRQDSMGSPAFDAADQLDRYVRWWHDGHRSSTGTCFDIGGTVRHCFLVDHGSSGQTDPALMERGRVTEIVAVFRAVARVNY